MGMAKTRIVQGMVMPKGWHYMQKLSMGREQRIDSHTCEALVQAIVDFRLTNQIPIGDPLVDLEAYVCTNFPHMCHSVAGALVSVQVSVSPTRSAPQQYVDYVVGWLEGQVRDLSPQALVLESEAQRRGVICERCPMNVPWKTSCGSCNDNVDRLATIIRQGHRLVRDAKLKSCKILHQENRTAVWLNESRLTSSPDLPGNCWLRK